LKFVGQHNFDEWPGFDVTAIIDFHEGRNSDLCGALIWQAHARKEATTARTSVGVPLRAFTADAESVTSSELRCEQAALAGLLLAAYSSTARSSSSSDCYWIIDSPRGC
jgi:hypothetical protein